MNHFFAFLPGSWDEGLFYQNIFFILTFETMITQPRDVTGGRQMWGSLIPGYNMYYYILGVFSVPIEVFLRRDFGESYYTKANFIGGAIILLIFNFFRSLGSHLNVGQTSQTIDLTI